MADKGVINHRKGSITFTVEYPSAVEGGKPELRDIVLEPGRNRLSERQYAALQRNAFFQNFLKETVREESETTQDEHGNVTAVKRKFTTPRELEVVDLPSDAPAPVATPPVAPPAPTTPQGEGTKPDEKTDPAKSKK